MSSCVLIVDDEPQVLKLFANLLKKGGYHVTVAGSGAEALLTLEGTQPIDLMVLDLDMPELDGFDLLKKLRGRRDLPILAVSGSMQGALLKPAELLGANGSLSKLDAPKLLVKTVGELLDSIRS
jgi:CheY-like chemotaxis protein